jgi:hypothetical protein
MMHASRVGVAKADTEVSPGGVMRLVDMEVKEVSLVDRPANKRPFLVVKRSDEDMPPTQVQPDGKGGFTAAAKAGPPPMPPGAGGEEPGKKKPKAVGKLDVPPGFKEMMGPMLGKASEKLKELADAVSSSSPAEISDDGEMPGVPAEFSDALGAIQGTLDKLSSMWPSAPTAPEGGNAEGEEPPMPTEMQMRASLDNLAKVFGRGKLEKAVIEKVGAKMAKERFAMLQQAYDQLGSLIGQLAPQAQQQAPAGALGKSNAPTEDLLKSIEGMLTPLVDGMKKLGGAVKKQRDDINTIQKSRGIPNSAAVEREGTPISKSDDDFRWPVDLNDESARKENVEKTISFFGDD